ncbi:MAG: hypothetical protein EA427_02235 [Spirochaetaceae bacterium]|nr:MAG: hypothetical protein EA427_02235 [Spirochaetaceae bacterium]
MWNYRVVRKKYVYHDSLSKKERTDYTYSIHEAYYDKNGFVGAITKDPIEPFGENIEELRHSWAMMAEAFGKPILDSEEIPEPGYERIEDPIGSELDRRVKDFESGETKGIPWEQVKKDLEAKWGSSDEDACRKQIDDERLEKEQSHSEAFIGISVLEDLITKICTDYINHI